VIHACVSTDRTDGSPVNTIGQSYVRIVDPSLGQHCDTTTNSDGLPGSESNVSFNQRGPTGPQGPRGARGRAITIAGGNVITIRGEPITVGSSSKGVTINTPPIRGGSKPIATLTLDLGGSKLSAPIFSYSLARAHGGGGGAGRVATHEIVIVKKQDKASPKLLQFCATGKHIVRGTITVRKAGKGQQEFLTIKLDSVLISSYQTGGSGGSAQPTESLSLNFSKIEYKYTKQ
jgi:hypothetical protein